MSSEASIRSSSSHDPDTVMAAVFRLYPGRVETSDAISRHWKFRRAVKQLKATLDAVQEQLNDELSIQLSDDENRNAASDPNEEPTIVPQKINRRVALSTDQPLDVDTIMQVNQLYHAESKVLESSQDLAIHCMLQGMAVREGNDPISAEIPQRLNAYHTELRRYRISDFLKQQRIRADLHQDYRSLHRCVRIHCADCRHPSSSR